MSLKNSTLRGYNVDHWPRSALVPTHTGENVSLRIEAHTINSAMRTAIIVTELLKHHVLSEGAIVIYRIGPQLAKEALTGIRLRNVKRAFVAR